MDDHSIREAMLMSSISKYPVNITDGWVAWSNIVITKRMALAFLTKLYGGPLPRLMYDVLYEGYASDIEQVPEEYRLLLRPVGMYWNYHTRQSVLRETEETTEEWFRRLYFNITYSILEKDNEGKQLPIADDYKKVAIERMFLYE